MNEASVDGGAPSVLDLARKTSRQVVENAAMAAAIAQREAGPAGGPVLMNRPGVGPVRLLPGGRLRSSR